MKLLDGEPLSGGEFIVKISTAEASSIAWALMHFAGRVPLENGKKLRDLSFQFADLSGDH